MSLENALSCIEHYREVMFIPLKQFSSLAPNISKITRKLLNQYFQMVKSSLSKFYGRHHELVDRYGITVSQMISDMFLTS